MLAAPISRLPWRNGEAWGRQQDYKTKLTASELLEERQQLRCLLSTSRAHALPSPNTFISLCVWACCLHAHLHSSYVFGCAACLPACLWDSSNGAFGGSLSFPFYMCKTPRSARGELPPIFLGCFLWRLKYTYMCLTLQIPRRVLVAFCFPNSHTSISKFLWTLCSSAFPSVLLLRLFVIPTVLM